MTVNIECLMEAAPPLALAILHGTSQLVDTANVQDGLQHLYPRCTKPERDADRKRKFPLIKRDYESASVPDMYFVRLYGTFPRLQGSSRRLHPRLPLHRRTLQFEYLEEFPLALLSALEKKTGRAADGREVLTVAMRYNPSFSGPRLDTFHSWRATDDVNNAHNSNFLHPVIYYYAQHKEGGEDGGMEEVENKYGNPGPPVPDRVHHMLEDFLTQWTSPHLHVEPLRKFLESCLGVDLRRYRNTECFAKLLDGATDTSSPLPLSCIQRPDLGATHFVHHDHRVGHSGTGR
ncbi:hypothetical protein HPB48_020582 [Haemaphysalis longicornis]|uniref:Uncharacterized protein n=1 Tax=Haemaphysalis longicornis TaxID=44386 RepID=A0A9J6FGS9_HAELO|nr:hypothetical protein HPB48_020582 [Haemaphysalis longicornis]